MPETGRETPMTRDEPELTEAKMRRALGLDGPTLTLRGNPDGPRPSQQGSDASQGRHIATTATGTAERTRLHERPDDGAPLRQRVLDLERQLAAERQQHAETGQRLKHALAAAQAAETRLSHGVLTQEEELQSARRALGAARRALGEAELEQRQRQQRDQDSTVTTPSRRAVPQQGKNATPAPTTKPERKTRGQLRSRPAPEPKPVRWWTPSYRAKAGR